MNINKTASDEQPTLYDTRNFYTKTALESSENQMKLKLYESIMNLNSVYPYRYFATFTFSKPVVDEVAVCTSNLHLKRFIKKKLYNRRADKSNLKFAFFIEPHTLQHKSQNKLHVHFLMTACDQSSLHLDALTSEILQLRKLKSALKDVLRRVHCFDTRICAKLNKFDIKHVNDKEALTDYLMKQLRRDSIHDVTSMIDINNSDLIF